jgi:predicted unusual protein kinase regulating ubiquinone biosynthesis (AarF/ABC1/UbiB family)
MFHTFKQVLFLINVFFIISSELCFYVIYKDLQYFITRITDRLATSNILYVKVFQAIALNNSLIDEKINNQLLKFTDNAPWNYSDTNLEELIEVTDKYNLILPYGYEMPINSGMISLVFKAYNRDTKAPLIIKMKRKDIDIKLNDAIENLQFFMYILTFIPIIQKYQIVEVINKNIDMIRHQTNFSLEVDNMIKVKNNCNKLKYVVIPEVYKEVTREYPNVILMEYINGIKINQIKEEDYEDFAKQIIKFGFVTSVIHGVAHGDLHGGNILFIKDESQEKYKHKIGVIDFGIIYELDTKYKSNMFSLLTEVFERTPRESAINLLNSGIIEPENIFNEIPNEDREQILNFTCEIIQDTIQNSKKANQFQMYKLMSNLKEYLCNSKLSNIGIRPSESFVKTQLVLAMTHGVTLTLCKDDFITVADKVLNELFNTNLIL